MTTNRTDEDLVLERTGASLAMLVERHWQRAYRVALAITRDPGAAEDAAQETFVRLASSAARFEAERGFAPWFHRIAVNVARNHGRSRRRRARHEERAASRRGEPIAADPAEAAVAGEVHEALDRLPDEYRRALVLHYFEGRTHEEVAKALGVPAGTASSRIRRGLEKLQESVRGAATVVLIEELLKPRGDAPAAPVGAILARAARPAFAVKVAAALAIAAALVAGAAVWQQ